MKHVIKAETYRGSPVGGGSSSISTETIVSNEVVGP